MNSRCCGKQSKSFLHLNKARLAAANSIKVKRSKYFADLDTKNLYLIEYANNLDVSKLILAALYLGEGGKTLKRASVLFGNSDHNIIKLFLELMRKCYSIDEHKFRCTVQCRWGQNEEELTKYWSRVTGIPKEQFYKSRIDPRTVNKKILKPNYKGVCRIDYLSATVFHDILSVINVLTGARSSAG